MLDKPIELKRSYGIEPRRRNKLSVSTKLVCIEAIQNNESYSKVLKEQTKLELSSLYGKFVDINAFYQKPENLTVIKQ